MTKPTNLQELEAWLANNKNHGCVDDIPIIDGKSSEIRGHFTISETYNQSLLLGDLMGGMSKTDIAQTALRNLYFMEKVCPEFLTQIAESVIDSLEPVDVEFRYYLSGELKNNIVQYLERWGTMTTEIALAAWIYLPVHQQFMEEMLGKKAIALGLTVEETKQKIFDLRRYKARVKRYEQSKRLGYFVSDRKMP